MSLIDTSTFPELLYPGLRKAIDDGFRQYKPVYKAIANVERTDREFFDDLDMTGIGTFAQVTEGSTIPQTSPIQGYKTRYVVNDYGEIIPITHKMLRGDLYNVNTTSNLFVKLGKGANRTIDQGFFSMFNNGFTAAYMSYGDAKPLFSTIHPRKDGGTAQSNASATSAPLSASALFVGENAIREVLDHKGQVVDIGEGQLTLLIPPALEKKAVELTESELDPESAANTLGFHKYVGRINVIVCKWISAAASGSDTAWFLIANGDHQLNLFVREGFETDWWEEKNSRTIQVRGTLAFCYGWSSWMGVYGSQGTGAAFAL